MKTMKNMESSTFHQIIIIGCGPSSLSAAIQLKRNNIPFLMITEEMGGLIQNANSIENLLGFPKGISGKDFVDKMQESINKYNLSIIYDKVIGIKFEEEKYWIRSQLNSQYTCKYLIVGTGTIPNTLNISGEIESHKNGLLFYDIYNYTPRKGNKSVGVVGSGDAAYDYALQLEKSVKSIEILQRSSKSKALPLLIDRVGESKAIEVIKNVKVKKIVSDEKQIKLELEDQVSYNKVVKKYDVLFVTIGRSPNVAFLSPDLRVFFENRKYKKENFNNIWFIGDVKNQKLRQLAIAMGDGIKVGMKISAMLHK